MKKIKISDLIDNCSVCLMRAVCKYEDQDVDVDMETIEAIKKALPSGISYKATCEHCLHSECPTITPLSPDPYQPYLNSAQSDCTTCPNDPAKLDHPIIGDSPCQWCEHSPMKVTY